MASFPSLQRQYTFYFTFVSTILFSLSIILLIIHEKNMKEDISKRSLNLAHSIANQVDTYLHHDIQDLKILAAALNQMRGEPDNYQKTISELHSFRYIFEQIAIVDKKGIVKNIIPYREDYIGIDMSGQKFFEYHVSEAAPTVFRSDSFISSQTGKPAVSISVPFKKGFIVAILSMHEFGEVVRVFFPSESGFIAVLDSSGVVIAHSDAKYADQRVNLRNLGSVRRGLTGTEGFFEDTWNGIRGIAAVSPVSNSGWLVVIFQPEAEAFFAVRKFNRIALTILLLTILIAFATLFFFQRRFFAPIGTMKDQAMKVADGDYDVEIFPKYSEFYAFIESFNNMAKSIKSREDTLRKLSTAVEQSPGIVVITDIEGKIEYVNSKFTEITGFSRDEAIGENPRVLKSEFTSPDVHEELWKTITSGRVWRGVFCNRKKNGDLYWEAASISPIKDPEGDITHYIALKEDITQQKRVQEELKESENKYRLLADNLTDVIWTMDMDLNRTYISPSVMRVRGFSVEEIMGMSLAESMTPESYDRIIEVFREELLLEAGGKADPARSWRIEVEFFRKDGSRIWCETTAALMRDEYGKAIGFLGVTRDIEAQKEAENALMESEILYRKMFHENPQPMMMHDMEAFNFLEVNTSAVEHYGYSRDEFLRMTVMDIRPPEDVDRALKAISESSPGRSRMGIWKHIKKNGDEIDVDIITYDFEYEGKPARLALANDVTEQLKAQEALKESEERFRRISEGAFEGIVFAEKGKVIDANTQIADMLGYSLPELIGSEIMDMVAPESRELVLQKAKEGYPGVYEHKALKKDGSKITVQARGSATTYNRRPVRVTSIMDITERKLADRMLEESEEKYRILFESGNDAIYIAVPDTKKLLDFNETARRRLGYTRDELLDMTLYDITADELKGSVPLLLDRLSRESSYIFEHRHQRKDGSTFPVEISSHLTEYGGREVIQSNVRDITQRKEAETALAESELRYASFIESFPGIVFRGDLDSRVIFFHGSVEEVSGYTENDFVTGEILWNEVILSEDFSKNEDEYNKLINVRNYSTELEYRILKKDGNIRWIKEFAHNIFLGGEKATFIQGTMMDITDRKSIEEALNKSSQLAAVGQIASGIAHEINNPLATISACSEALIARLEDIMPKDMEHRNIFQEYLAMIQDEVYRSSGIIRNLLDFARIRPFKNDPIDMKELVSSTVRAFIIQGQYNNFIFDVQTEEGLHKVLGDRDKLRQVLVILILNAIDASPNGGRITISSACSDGSDVLQLSVTDEGTGIPDDIVKKIFEPFFTTKPPGKGTGLGLSIADSIISKHNGRMLVKTGKKKGTTIHIQLPVSIECGSKDAGQINRRLN